jgi:hypothetical protein
VYGLVVGAWLVLGLPCALHAADAVEPAEVSTRPTWSCMGINWPFQADGNRNASVAVAFRRTGTSEWRPALPLWLHEYRDRRMFSGSVFRLAPGTAYEFRLTMKDPDGGGTVRTLTAATLPYPRMPSRVVRVPAGGLQEAQRLAAPGTVMLLGAGTYPGTELSRSGRPGKWIVYRAAPGGQVVIEGRVTIRADYVWLHGLTIRGGRNAVQGSHKGVCITNCRIFAHYAIHTGRGGENYFIADNDLHGDADGRFTMSGEGVDFGPGRGACGHAVCFNEFTDFADGVSYGRGDIDVHNNYFHEILDDFVEPDYAAENYRVWNNHCCNAMCAFSWQPMRGGPWYVFNNVSVGAYLHSFKVRSISGPSVIYGNSILTKSSTSMRAAAMLRGTFLNNAWLRVTAGSLGYGGRLDFGSNPTRVDYNAYGTGGTEPFRRIGYAKRVAEQGWDAHSRRVDYRQVLAERVRVPAGRPHYSRGMHGMRIPADWQFEHVLLLPRAGSKLIDAGTALANLTGPYLGKSPDVGAHELGLGTAWYGRRSWDEQSHLVYGIPKGWKKTPLSGAKAYAALGCPVLAPDARVLLTAESPRVFALMRVEPAKGEDRWRRAAELVADDAGALTGVLRFQDGLFVRLYEVSGAARLLAARVEPNGVLRVLVGCRAADLPAARLAMFQFVRSLYR